MQYVILKNQKLVKQQEARGLLSSLGIKSPSRKSRSSFVLTVLNKLTEGIKLMIKLTSFYQQEMNLMPEMHLRQAGFTQSPCGPFT